jgi:hypothetical protein
MKEPFINHMFPGIHRPWEEDYKARTKDVVLYEHTTNLGPCYYCGDEDCDEECEDALEDKEEMEDFQNKDQPALPKLDLSKVTLQTLLDLLPEGVSPSDVKIRLHIDDDSHQYTKHGISFYYKKKFPADPEGFKKAQAKYKECEAAYDKKRAEYDEWKASQEVAQKQKEIRELKEKLKQLKK